MSHWTYRGEEVNELPAGKRAFTYVIKLPSGKMYLGETGSPKWYEYHGSGADLMKHKRKHGFPVYGRVPGAKYLVIEFYETKAMAQTAEVHLIRLTGAVASDLYLNASHGGSLGTLGMKLGPKVLSEETRRKISEGNKGKVVYDHTRLKLSKVHKGRTFSQKQRDNIGKAKSGENCHASVRTWEQIREMRRLHGIGLTPNEIAELQPVKTTGHYVSKVLRNAIWKVEHDPNNL